MKRAVLFIAAALMQIAVIAGILISHETAVITGTDYRFPVEPIDPIDIFQGRYLALSFRGTEQQVSHSNFTRNQSVYALLAVDTNGHAVITNLSASAPKAPFMKVKVSSAYGSRVWIAFPFSRYYLPEDAALPAERAYWNATRRRDVEAYALVAVDGNGTAVLKDVIVNGMPILDYVKNTNRR